MVAKIKVICVNCGKEVERYPSRVHATTFCSRGCRSDYFKLNNTEAFKCHHCGKEKRVRKSDIRREGNNFCSRVCKDTWQREGLKGSANPFYNKRHSDEARRKNSESKIAQGLTGERAHNYSRQATKCCECGEAVYKIPYLLKRNERNFCSISCKGAWLSKYAVGESNPAWNPDLTQEERDRGRNYPEYYEFIRSVLKRDEYMCRICMSETDALNVHHINSYDWDKGNRTNVNNGVTLCRTCHTDFHKQFGYGKNTRSQFLTYLQKLAC